MGGLYDNPAGGSIGLGAGAPLIYKPVTRELLLISEEAARRMVARLVLDMRWNVSLEQVEQGPRRSLFASAEDVAEDEHVRAMLSSSTPLCDERRPPEECLHLLERGVPPGSMGRRMMALSFALDTVWEGVGDAARASVDPATLRAMVVSTIGMSLLMLVSPEPVTKLVAVAMTACLIAYLGTGPLWNMVQAFRVLMKEAEQASRIGELREAGHRFGRVLGDNGARVLLLVAMTALGGKAALASEGPQLPGFAQAVLRARAEAGFELKAALTGEVHALSLPSVAVLDIALAPTAVAAVAMGPGGGVQGEPDGQVHHICTDKNEVSDASGGPWTPTFRRYFKRAGMELSDPENQVRINGHKGPHPREYHVEVRKRIDEAMLGCRNTAECRAALSDELRRIARELTTAGTQLRKLVTKTPEG